MEGQVGHDRGSAPDDLEVESQKIAGIAGTLIDDLIKAAGTFIQDPEYSQVKASAALLVQDL